MSQRLDESAPIGKMGLPANDVSKLSPAGQKLTKADLVALWENKVTATASHVTLGDIEVIKAGFAPQMRGGARANLGDINCCCCPCCCATAVVRPLRATA